MELPDVYSVPIRAKRPVRNTPSEPAIRALEALWCGRRDPTVPHSFEVPGKFFPEKGRLFPVFPSCSLDVEGADLNDRSRKTARSCSHKRELGQRRGADVRFRG